MDGPRIPPAAGGKPTSLVVLLHGYGSNGADLIGLAPYFAKALPTTQFVAPNAPEPMPMAAGGFQWFPLMRLDQREVDHGVRRHEDGLNRFIDRELDRYQLPAQKLFLLGFSQGCMMALHVGLRRERIGGVVGFSGMLAAPEAAKSEARNKPPILLVHGDQDDVIPVQAMFLAGQGLAEADQSCLWHVSFGLPHAIGPDGIEYASAFLKANGA
jgi:phospholipase/carboxylesterase